MLSVAFFYAMVPDYVYVCMYVGFVGNVYIKVHILDDG